MCEPRVNGMLMNRAPFILYLPGGRFCLATFAATPCFPEAFWEGRLHILRDHDAFIIFSARLLATVYTRTTDPRLFRRPIWVRRTFLEYHYGDRILRIWCKISSISENPALPNV